MIVMLGLFGKYSGHTQNMKISLPLAGMIRKSRYGKKLSPRVGMLFMSLRLQLQLDVLHGLHGNMG
jgi:hypothetical protein